MTFLLKVDLDMVKMYLHTKKQESIPVGCVLCAAVAMGRVQGGCCPGGVWCLTGVVSRGVWCQGGVVSGRWWCPREVCAPVHVGIHPSPTVNRMTDACENITLPQRTFADGN